MKCQPIKLFQFSFSFLFVPYVLCVLFFLSNCEGSGEKFPSIEEDVEIEETTDTTTQEISVDETTTCTAVTYFEDWDNDGYGNLKISAESCTQPDGYVTDNTDCDDDMYYVNPGMDGMDDNSGMWSEVYSSYLFEGIDNDCDDEIDEDTVLIQAPDSDWWHDQMMDHITFEPVTD